MATEFVSNRVDSKIHYDDEEIEWADIENFLLTKISLEKSNDRYRSIVQYEFDSTMFDTEWSTRNHLAEINAIVARSDEISNDFQWIEDFLELNIDRTIRFSSEIVAMNMHSIEGAW